MFSLRDLRSSLFSWDLDELLAQRIMDFLSELPINQRVQKVRSRERSCSCCSCCPRFCTASAVQCCVVLLFSVVFLFVSAILALVLVVVVALTYIVAVSSDFIKPLWCYLRFVVRVIVVVVVLADIVAVSMTLLNR